VHPLTCEEIQSRLQHKFAPSKLIVNDESHKHRGHAESKKSGGGHFQVEMVAAAFSGLTLKARHQCVQQLFADDFASGRLHALALKLSAP